MALTLGGVSVPAPPASSADPVQVFKALQEQYTLDQKVVDFMLGTSKLTSLEDFVHLFSGESDVGPYIELMKLGEGAPLQTSRLRRAWRAIKTALDQQEKAAKATADEPDLDAPLPKRDLERVAEQFWRRYKISLPASVEPCDTLKARTIRELGQRLISVRPIWKVRSMIHQVHAAGRSSEIAAKSAAPQDEESEAKTLAAYLGKLRTLCFAYAIAGSDPLVGAPQEAETRASDSTNYVLAPLDTMLRYYYRAEERALRVAEMQPGEALAWLAERDEAERTAWVEAHRSSALPFGRIVKQAFVEREATWLVDNSLKRKAPDRKTDASGGGGQRRPSPPKRAKADLTANTRARKLASGKLICQAWNQGGCKSPCPKGEEHVCNRACKFGRACGMSNHKHDECRNKKRLH